MNEAQRYLALQHALKLIGQMAGLRHDGEVVITATHTDNFIGFDCIVNEKKVRLVFDGDYSVSASIGSKYEDVGRWGDYRQHENIATFVNRVIAMQAKDEQTKLD